ncbi:hypothetical protein CV_0859 [Chromobacterium violaceum ATCC 12472]|uniref:Uncharacterized protein n=1 Tax=Chromobacterium violaceum (strain ATCC 12472 / DSM 30191 / JCM 1249 / CCUG 213 / NBRC 12614 / NCIMB 9131 / NCTC 9757 / MK) TaxID=243365 RepID=Q7NZR2_CHRVO|nr:hypothetical protein CV_0859 [Chromobacterium violaceum ATCC 12472]
MWPSSASLDGMRHQPRIGQRRHLRVVWRDHAVAALQAERQLGQRRDDALVVAGFRVADQRQQGQPVCGFVVAAGQHRLADMGVGLAAHAQLQQQVVHFLGLQQPFHFRRVGQRRGLAARQHVLACLGALARQQLELGHVGQLGRRQEGRLRADGPAARQLAGQHGRALAAQPVGDVGGGEAGIAQVHALRGQLGQPALEGAGQRQHPALRQRDRLGLVQHGQAQRVVLGQALHHLGGFGHPAPHRFQPVLGGADAEFGLRLQRLFEFGVQLVQPRQQVLQRLVRHLADRLPGCHLAGQIAQFDVVAGKIDHRRQRSQRDARALGQLVDAAVAVVDQQIAFAQPPQNGGQFGIVKVGEALGDFLRRPQRRLGAAAQLSQHQEAHQHFLVAAAEQRDENGQIAPCALQPRHGLQRAGLDAGLEEIGQ